MLMEQGEGKFWSRKGQGSAKGRNEWREGRGRKRKVRVEKDGVCISLRREGVGQKEESICEKCAPGKYFYKVQKRYGAAHGKCASKGEEKAMLMKQEKRKFRWRGDKERENK